MNRHPLLAENENKQISVGLPLLLCLSMFTTWQMGVMLFSGKTLSIGAKTPIPFALDSNVITALVAAGFIADSVSDFFTAAQCYGGKIERQYCLTFCADVLFAAPATYGGYTFLHTSLLLCPFNR